MIVLLVETIRGVRYSKIAKMIVFCCFCLHNCTSTRVTKDDKIPDGEQYHDFP